MILIQCQNRILLSKSNSDATVFP